MQACALRTAPSSATAPATSAAYAHCSSSVNATEATSHAAAVTASAVSSISAHRCLIAWNFPIFWPNCSRTPAYSTAVSRHQRAMPDASAAASVTAVRRTSSVVSPSTGCASPRSTSTSRPNRRVEVGAQRRSRSSPRPAGTTTQPFAVGREQVGGRGCVPAPRHRGRVPTTPPRGAHPAPQPRPSARAAGRGPARGHRLRGRPPRRASSRLRRRPTRAARSSARPSRSSAAQAVGEGRRRRRPRRRARASRPRRSAAHLRRLAASSTCSSEIPIDMWLLAPEN